MGRLIGLLRATLLIGLLILIINVLKIGSVPKIDGYAVGDRTCVDGKTPGYDNGWWCDGARAYAQAKLDTAAPTHAPIVTVEEFSLPPGTILQIHGTTFADGIVVFHLADQRVHAFGVGCIVFAGVDPRKASMCSLNAPDG